MGAVLIAEVKNEINIFTNRPCHHVQKFYHKAVKKYYLLLFIKLRKAKYCHQAYIYCRYCFATPGFFWRGGDA